MSWLAGSLRRSYQPTVTCVPSGVTATVGCHWSLVPASVLTRTGVVQVAPPLVEAVKKTFARWVPDPLSGNTQYSAPVTGLTTACGNWLVRNPNPRSPFGAPVPASVATVTVGPKVSPRSFDCRKKTRAGREVLSNQNTD